MWSRRRCSLAVCLLAALVVALSQGALASPVHRQHEQANASAAQRRNLLWLRDPLEVANDDHMLRNARVLVTGGVGFIGFHLAATLVQLGNDVVVLDNFNSYYDVRLKEARAHKLFGHGVRVVNGDICDFRLLEKLFEQHGFTHVAHLAAQAGVRYSVNHPHDYIRSNVDCFVNILEELRTKPEVKLVYASSSSVYGKDATIPFTEKECSDKPTNVYGATKRMNELLAHSYHHLYNISATGLRFFTVFGPWGRPDMAPFIFTERVMRGDTIDVYHTADGEEMRRDFTYVDDIVDGIVRSLHHGAGYDVFNLGRGHPTSVPQFIEMIESATGKPARRNDMEAHAAELPETYADVSHAADVLDYSPKMATDEGVNAFVGWYKWYSEQGMFRPFPRADYYFPGGPADEAFKQRQQQL
ncbi:NAD-dependent epimerase/dehydratase [Salpingoeca rosetta]|uniref:NAD-dependent epimerase/dehydratase n=1 Tax=Salpingoeca rosetta (strain ATCC 50818 / BSB-021) TaxID=946362 RepID=F2UM98_SALR5|nr:NAD-dependent epimerase/dehydratase [Salpingoeca rosetta]EGD78247.1 NAD-dependent epimerase/dehydratase [Salpingoeca rosetta]|eukprot:XP_004989570.1 NAD-dependent epimerase/dehydratase [Salpingoeca rosetta]